MHFFTVILYFWSLTKKAFLVKARPPDGRPSAGRGGLPKKQKIETTNPNKQKNKTNKFKLRRATHHPKAAKKRPWLWTASIMYFCAQTAYF